MPPLESFSICLSGTNENLFYVSANPKQEFSKSVTFLVYRDNEVTLHILYINALCQIFILLTKGFRREDFYVYSPFDHSENREINSLKIQL